MENKFSSDDFLTALRNNNIPCSSEQIRLFELYFEFLAESNKVMNLTAIVDRDEVYIKHFLDSVMPFFNCEHFDSICDVGSGAGFPSIPLKILFPHIAVSIVEPIAKRTRFLNDLCTLLKLDNVVIYNQRSEDFVIEHRESFDIVVARAVASLPIVCELCIPLAKVDGYFLAMRGKQGEDELSNAANAIKILNSEVAKVVKNILPDEAQRINIWIKKEASTNTKFPRNYGQIKKKCL